MVWGIIGALPEEVSLLCDAMEITGQEQHYGSTFYRGTLEGKQVVVVCCSIGKVNAALCTSLIIREMNADAVINVGIAGAMDKRLKVLDVVLSTNVAFHDAEPIMKNYYPFHLDFDADEKLLSIAQRACKELNGEFTHYCGRIATGDVFVQGGSVKDKIVEHLSPLCVEMEGAAIAHAAFVNDKPFLIIRTISDSADDEASLTYDVFKDRAAEQSAHIVRNMLKLSDK